MPRTARRVLIMPKWYPWPDRPVFGLFCREQARAVAASNDVRVMAFSPERMSGPILFRSWLDGAEPVWTLRLAYRRPALRPAAMATQLIGMRAALRGMERSGWRPDLIHAHVFEAGFPAVLLGRRLRCPVVVSEHFTAFQRGLVRGADRRVAAYCFRHADLVCPVSEDLRRQLETIEPRGRYRVVPNMVDTTLFRPPPQPRPRRANGAIRLLNVAALNEKKRHADLLEAVARLRARGADIELDVVGDGELCSPLRARAEELVLGESVRFLGSRGPAEVSQLMREADVFVLPSRFENLPVVLLEAMASGLPVVATAVGGIPEIVDAQVGRLVAPGEVDRLTSAIEDVASRLGSFDSAALAERAGRRYGAEAVGRVWDEIYDELLARRCRGQGEPARSPSG
jgi:glycosyltransferase involved in cell wall biosynthesis